MSGQKNKERKVHENKYRSLSRADVVKKEMDKSEARNLESRAVPRHESGSVYFGAGIYGLSPRDPISYGRDSYNSLRI